jgi:hypothetical protein
MLNIEDILLHEEKLSNILDVSINFYLSDLFIEPTQRFKRLFIMRRLVGPYRVIGPVASDFQVAPQGHLVQTANGVITKTRNPFG